MSLVERDDAEDGIVILRLNRPDRLNALTPALVGELHDHLDRLRADNRCRVVVLTGNGRGFCAGADLRGGDPGSSVPFEARPGVIGTFQHAEYYSDVVLK